MFIFKCLVHSQAETMCNMHYNVPGMCPDSNNCFVLLLLLPTMNKPCLKSWKVMGVCWRHTFSTSSESELSVMQRLWKRATLALLPRKMSFFWLFLSLCFFPSLDAYQKFQFFHFKKIVAQRLLAICIHLILIIHILDFSVSNETWFIFYYLFLFI